MNTLYTTIAVLGAEKAIRDVRRFEDAAKGAGSTNVNTPLGGANKGKLGDLIYGPMKGNAGIDVTRRASEAAKGMKAVANTTATLTKDGLTAEAKARLKNIETMRNANMIWKQIAGGATSAVGGFSEILRTGAMVAQIGFRKMFKWLGEAGNLAKVGKFGMVVSAVLLALEGIKSGFERFGEQWDRLKRNVPAIDKIEKTGGLIWDDIKREFLNPFAPANRVLDGLNDAIEGKPGASQIDRMNRYREAWGMKPLEGGSQSGRRSSWENFINRRSGYQFSY